jgi:hypothetical protein
MLPWVPNKKQRPNAHQPNDEKKKSNEACLGDEHDDDESDKDGHVPPLFFSDSWNGSRLLSHGDRPSLSDKPKERQLENHDHVEMNKHAVEGRRWRRIAGDDFHDADEARTCKGTQPYDAEAMAKFSFSLSRQKDVSKTAATFGRDDDNNNYRLRSGLFTVDVADEARKAKGVFTRGLGLVWG